MNDNVIIRIELSREQASKLAALKMKNKHRSMGETILALINENQQDPNKTI